MRHVLRSTGGWSKRLHGGSLPVSQQRWGVMEGVRPVLRHPDGVPGYDEAAVIAFESFPLYDA
jgi:hypothetical protein